MPLASDPNLGPDPWSPCLTQDSSALGSVSDFILALPGLHQAHSPLPPTHYLIEIRVGKGLSGSGGLRGEGNAASSGAQTGRRDWGELHLCLLCLGTFPSTA